MIGGSEILLILLAILLLFGSDKLPGFAKSLGKGMREIKKATDEIKDEISRETSTIKEELTKETEVVKIQMTEMSDEVKKQTDAIKPKFEGNDPLSRI